MDIFKSTYDSIINTIGTLPPEKGGFIGGINNQICAFQYDENAYTSKKVYYPSERILHSLLDKWIEETIEFYGIIHSHRAGLFELSQQDIVFARAIIASNNKSFAQIYFPIVFSCYDSSQPKILPYAVSPTSIWLEQLNIIF